MGKFRFQTQTPAKVANPAKNQEQQGFSSAKALLNVAKMQTGHMDTPSTLANFSKPLASQDAIPTNALASLAGLAAPEGESQTPPPDLSKIKLTHHREYKSLWYRAWKLADYIDGEAPYQDRIAKLPEYDDMIERLGVLECQGQKTNKG